MTELLFTLYTAIYGLPDGLLSAVCYVESEHNIKAVNKQDGDSASYGICQVKLDTANRILKRNLSARELMNPGTNIRAAAALLSYQYKRYNSWNRAVVAYNKGSSNEQYGYKQNRYWRSVNARWRRFPKEYGRVNVLRRASR